MSTTKREVKAYLDRFKAKMDEQGIIFLSRRKNQETLSILDIESDDREHYVRQLGVQHYCAGPLDDDYGGTDVWVFGITVVQREVYVKITIKGRASPCVCISFHLAEQPIEYPFKNPS